MRKKFNVNEIVHERKNELDSSPLFQSQSPSAPAQAASNTTASHSEQVEEARRPSPLARGKTAPSEAQPFKRAFVRRTFDFYEEQIAYLKHESLREQFEGKEGSMNAMVREAIDDWIKKRTSGK